MLQLVSVAKQPGMSHIPGRSLLKIVFFPDKLSSPRQHGNSKNNCFLVETLTHNICIHMFLPIDNKCLSGDGEWCPDHNLDPCYGHTDKMIKFRDQDKW